MAKRVLVVGARGFLGEHVVQQLAVAGHEVLAAARQTAAIPVQPGITPIEGDCADATFIRGALDRVDAAIFCAGRTWRPGLPISEYHRQNVGVAQAFFDALGDRPRMRVLFTSSLSTISGSRDSRVYGENTGRVGIQENWLTPYDRAKIACEELALASARRGNDVIILNPGLLLGPGAQGSSNVAAPYYLLWFCQGQFTAKFYVNGGVTLSDVRDVARAFVTALQRGRAGERYILGGHNIDRREFYGRVARLTGLRPPRALPAWYLYGLMAANDGLCFATRGLIASPVHRSFARTQGLYYYGASDKAASEFEYHARPLEATLLDMLQDYQARGLLPASLDFVKDMTPEAASAFVLLKQLVARSGYGEHLLGRLSALHDACLANYELRDAFTRLQANSIFDDRRGCFFWKDTVAKEDLKTIQKFLEYVYFSSNHFLQKVL